MRSLPKVDRKRKKILKKLEKAIGIRFKKIGYLEWALQHRSYVNEAPQDSLINNEQLEFLGDSILGYVIAEYLFQKYPKYSEGKLSIIKASLVNKDALSELARKYHLGDYLLLGKGEEKGGGRKRDSIVSDAFEALVAAYYLDRGFKAVSRFLAKLYKKPIQAAVSNKDPLDNAKNRLQKITQSKFSQLPEYILLNEHGPQHKKVFEIEVKIKGQTYGRGRGKTKKKAEEEAAIQALDNLKEENL